MKNTGIVRRLDDLGRVVIPKEIRRTHGIVEGTPLEIYVAGENIVIKKYVEAVSTTTESNAILKQIELARNIYFDVVSKPEKYRSNDELARAESSLITLECLGIELGLIETGTI